MESHKQKSTEEPQALPRYQMMAVLRHQEPLSAEKFAEILERHRQFLASGGSGGRWETFVTTGGQETGVIVGVYVGQASKDTEGEQADLQHENLAGLDLRGIDLRYANMCGASGQGQDLSGARLDGSLVTDADFSGACFRGTNLTRADFSRSELANCDFKRANLSFTDFDYADLSGSDLSGAQANGTRFEKAKMEGVVSKRLTTWPSDQLLRDAARSGDLQAVNDAIGQGADVDARGEYGDTALNLAAEYGRLEVARRLLEAGANIENVGGAGKTPLMNASFAGEGEIAKLLLGRGARINRDLLASLQAKINILAENAEDGMVNPEAAEAWRQFLEFMVETWEQAEGKKPPQT